MIVNNLLNVKRMQFFTTQLIYLSIKVNNKLNGVVNE